MRYLILIVFIIPAVFGVRGQDIRVLNARTNEPIENVLVVSKDFTTQTDENGRVSLANIEEDEPLLFQHSSFLKLTSTKRNIIAQGNTVLLAESPIHINEVVISVNRWEQSKAEIPYEINTVRPEYIIRYNPQTTADLLGAQGGVFVQKSQMGGGSPMIRGFAANRVLLVVDGIRMNNAIYRSGNLHNVISLDANSIESTEIIFGPGSVIYGSDALGGVMSFSTLTPRLSSSGKTEQDGKVHTRFSSANTERSFHFTYNIGSKKWAGLVSATFPGFDDLRMGAKGPEEYLRKEYVDPEKFSGTDEIIQNRSPQNQIPSGYSQLNLISKIRYRPNRKLDFTLSSQHSQTSEIPRYDRLIIQEGNSLKYGEWYYGPQKWTLISGRLNYQNNHFLFDRVNLLAGYQLYSESRNDRYLHSEILRQRQEDLKAISVNMDLRKKLNDYHEIFYGAETYLNKVGSAGEAENLTDKNTREIAPRYPDDSDYRSFAGYFSYKYNMDEKLIVQAGTRFTRTLLSGNFDPRFYNFPFPGFDMNNSAWNGNIGLVWHPTSQWQFNMNASTGFRSPNIDDVAKVFDSSPGNVVVPNPGLKPEYARNFEAGIIHRFSNKARLEVTAFYTRLKDAMVRRDFSFNGQDSIDYDGTLSKVEALVNAESAEIYGSNLSFEFLFSPVLRTKNNLTIGRGKDSDGFPVRHVPPTFGSSHLLFEKNRLFIDFYLEYSGKFDYEQLAPSEQDKPHLYAIDENGNPWSPSWWTLNLKSRYQANKMFSLSGGVENILNKRYRTYSSGIAAPGINFILSFAVQF